MTTESSRREALESGASIAEHAEMLGILPPGARGKSVGTERKRQRSSPVLVLVQDVRLLLIALWLGAAVFFSFAVAPSAFSVLPSREMAGAVVGRTLLVVNLSGFIIGLLLLASALVGRDRVGRTAFTVEVVSLVLLTAVTAVGQWVITARIEALRAQMTVPIDRLAQSDPVRAAFASAHGHSVLALSVGMLAALVALFLIAHRR